MKFKLISLFASIMAFISQSAFSQFNISGTVIDSTNQETVIGADITALSLISNEVLFVSSTDEEGRILINTDKKDFKLVVEYLGYNSAVIENIDFSSNTIDIGTVSLSTAPQETYSEVVIQGNKNHGSINTLYEIQKMTPVMSNGISSDIIQKSPDRNMGEVLKRISGASVQDNKFVVIRGMNDRYNLSTLDGAILPSTELNRKAFAFDMIPSYAVDQILVYKSGKPDVPSEFAGGLIQVITKSIPNSNFTQISIGSSYNTVSTGKDFKTLKHNASDFMSFGKSDRVLPSSFMSYNDMKDSRNYHPNNVSKNIPLIESLNHDFSHITRTALPGINLQLSHGMRKGYGNGNTLGFIAGVTLTHDEVVKPNVIRHYDNYSYNDNIYQYKSSVSGLFNIGFKTDKSTISWTNLFNNSFDDLYMERTGINWGNSSNMQYYALDLQEKLFIKSGLQFTHQFSDSGMVLDAKLATAYVNNHQPDQKKINYTQKLGTQDDFIASLNTVGKFNNRLYAQVKELTTTAHVDLTIPTSILNNTVFKVGLSEVIKHRDLSNRYLGLIINESAEIDQNILYQSKDKIFSDENIQNGSFKLVDQSSDGDFYTAQTYTTSAYAMADYNYGKNRIVGGVRFEHFGMNFNSINNADDYKISWTSILPSISWNYTIKENMLSRLSYFTSTIRPEIRELAPIGYYDYEMSAMVTGNPHLKPTTIHNLDYKWEIYPNKQELISIGLFYKYFINTIENRVYTSNSSYDIDPQNFDNAQNMGIELELRKNLGNVFKTEKLNAYTFYLNTTYTHSRTQLPDNFYIQGQLMTERPLSGQAPWMVNSGLYYTHPENKFSATLLYNFIDKSIYMLGHDRIGHIYMNSRHLMDFQFAFSPIEKLSVKLNVKDIFNTPITYFIDQNINGKLDNASRDISQQIDIYNDWIWQEYKPGSSIGLSIQYKF